MWDQANQALHQSISRLLNELAGVLPGLAALLAALLTSFLVAWIIGVCLRSLFTRIHFDERIHARGWAVIDWSPAKSPAILVTRLICWSVILIGLIVGVAAFDANMTYELVHSVVAYLPNLFGAALVLAAGTVVARFLGRSVLIAAVNINLQYARLLSVGVKTMVMVLAVAMSLEHLRIAPGIVQLAFGILFGGIVLALALAVGLGSKELVSRSLERETGKPSRDAVEEPFRHL